MANFEIRVSGADGLPATNEGDSHYQWESAIILSNENLMPLHITLPNGSRWVLRLSSTGETLQLSQLIDFPQVTRTELVKSLTPEIDKIEVTLPDGYMSDKAMQALAAEYECGKCLHSYMASEPIDCPNCGNNNHGEG